MDYLMVIDNATGDAMLMSLELASNRSGIPADEIEAAIEDTGRCTSLDFLIIDTRPADEVITV